MKRILMLFFVTVGFCSCDKESAEKLIPLKDLYKTYKNGEITGCIYNGRTVYVASLNVYDATNTVYDDNGNIIGDCNYGWGNVDPICEDLKMVETIYRCENHISGQPAIDKYNLSDL